MTTAHENRLLLLLVIGSVALVAASYWYRLQVTDREYETHSFNAQNTVANQLGATQ